MSKRTVSDESEIPRRSQKKGSGRIKSAGEITTTSFQ
jgi:hypothetical protein